MITGVHDNLNLCENVFVFVFFFFSVISKEKIKCQPTRLDRFYSMLVSRCVLYEAVLL